MRAHSRTSQRYFSECVVYCGFFLLKRYHAKGDQMGSLFCYISRQEMFGVLPGCLLSPGLRVSPIPSRGQWRERRRLREEKKREENGYA